MQGGNMRLSDPFFHNLGKSKDIHGTWLKLSFSFVILCVLVWVNELVDFPHLFLGAPSTPVNWIEATIETVIIICVGVMTIVVFLSKSKKVDLQSAGPIARNIWLPVSVIFFGLCLVFMIDEVFDIPGYVFSDAKTPINWHELIGETIIVAIVGLYATSSITQYAAQRDLAEDLFYKGFSFNPNPATITTLSGGVVIQVNDSFCNLTGYTRGELLNRSLLDLNIWVDPEQRARIVNDIKSGRSVKNVEIQIRDAWEEVHDCLFTAEPLEYKDKPCILAMAIDITEHKKTEQSLIKAEERYRHMFENTMYGIAVYEVRDDGNDFVFLDFNSAAETIENLNREDVVGKSVMQVFPNFKEFGLFEVFQRVWKTGIPEQFPVTLYKDERIEGWRDNNVYKLPTGEIVAVFSDETARMIAEEELRRSEEKFSRMFQASPDAISISTLDEGVYLDVNESFLNMIGYEYKEVVGRTSLELGVWEHYEDRQKLIHELDEKGGIRNKEVHFRTKSGSVLTILWSAERFVLGGEVYMLSIARDITERKNLEDELRRSQKMEAIGRLAGGITHDFSNLLTAVDGYCDLAMMKRDDAGSVKQNIISIKELTKKKTSLIKQLLAFSRKQVILPQSLDLNKIIKGMKSLLDQFVKENIELKTDLDPGICLIRADQGQMEQVIMNLALNARDAMPDGGELTFRTSKEYLDRRNSRKHLDLHEGEYIRFTISDTGIGMDEYTSSHLFEPFFTTKEEGKGTGLGLSTVYGIVKQSGGAILLESEPGKGTTFDILLPAAGREYRSHVKEAG